MTQLKIATWNCNGAFRRKLAWADKLEADVLIIQECEDPRRCTDLAYQAFAENYLWCGPTKNKGIGVFARQDILLERVDLAVEPLELFLPIKVNGDWPLLATWTRHANSPNFRYIGQLWKLLQKEKSFLMHPGAALIGDLNSNKRWDEWDRWWNHSDVVRELREIGLVSAYHHHFNEAQGEESQPTLYLQRNLAKAYHIDYGFFGIAWKITEVIVGTAADWLEVSDHMPVSFILEKQ